MMISCTKEYIFALLNLFLATAKAQYTIALEEELRTEVFTSYSKQQRPAKIVTLSLSLTILTVNELNIKDQTLSISGYLTVEWDDTRLQWFDTSLTTKDYTAVLFLFASEEYIWRPAILIENAVDGISVISGKELPMRITQRGHVIWNPAGIYKVSCESDTRYYPMDTQECHIKVSSWSYTSFEIRLSFKASSSVESGFYSENGEWELISLEEGKEEASSIGGESFAYVTFKIKLKRRLIFHLVNTLFPLGLMATLIAVVFRLSVESGEKIGFSLTVLLSYAVYLTLISDNIPSTSTTVCYLSLYLAFILLLATIAVCCTTFVINLHQRDDDENMSESTKRFAKKYLMTFACLGKKCSCNRGKVKDLKTKVHMCDQNNKRSEENVLDVTTEDNIGETDITWKQLSVIMDKVFFNIYIFLISTSTCALFLLILIGYITKA